MGTLAERTPLLAGAMVYEIHTNDRGGVQIRFFFPDPERELVLTMDEPHAAEFNAKLAGVLNQIRWHA